MGTVALRIVFAVILFAGILSDVEAQEDLALKHFEQGADYHLNGKNDEAIREFKKSLSYNKKSANTHYYLALIYELKNQSIKAVKHMLKAEKYFEAEGRDYWKDRSRKRIEEYYYIYGYRKEDFEK